MVEGLHNGFYYVVRGRILRIYAGRCGGVPLMTCCASLSSNEYDLHTVAWCRIDLHHAALCEALVAQGRKEETGPTHFEAEGD